MQKNYSDTPEFRWSGRVAQQQNIPAGCSKRPSSKAAASEDPEAYPLGYVEDLNDARTPLADFFSILLERLSLTPTRLFEEECALRKGLIASVGDLLGI